jgi:hypothetical protein
MVARSKTAVKVRSCSIEEQRAVFYARMRRLRGTRRMKMRFTLLERPAGLLRFKRVRAPGLSRWRRSAAGVRSYGYSQAVRGLHEGSAYRMRVRYRWYDRDGDLQRSARRTSRTCRMFVPLANLRVRALEYRALGGGVWRYRARVVNVGRAAADGVAVQLAVDGGVVNTETVDRLSPGEAAFLDFDGPACQRRYVFEVDPEHGVPEANEGDNRAFVGC